MRQVAQNRKSWQRKGILIFESFYYLLGRLAFIFFSFLLAQSHSFLISIENEDGRYANEWMLVAILIDCVLLIDLILHLIVYGPLNILKHKKEFIWEAFLQVIFLGLIIPYFSDSSLSVQIKMVELLALLLLLRLPIVCTLFTELKDF